MQLGFTFVYAQKFSNVILIYLVVEHDKNPAEDLNQHDKQQQYGNTTFQFCGTFNKSNYWLIIPA